MENQIQRETEREAESVKGARRENGGSRNRKRQREMLIGKLYLGFSVCSFPQLNNNSNSLVISTQLLSLPLSCLGAGKEKNQLCWRKDQGLKETFERKISLGVMHWRRV